MSRRQLKGMEAALDMDEVLGLHERFLDTCLKECLLASQDLLKNLTKIMTTCLLFADQVRRFSDSSAVATDPVLAVREGPPPRGRASNAGVSSLGAELSLLGEEEAPARAKPSSATSKSREARAARLGAQTAFVRQEAGHESFKRLLNKFADTFDTQVRPPLLPLLPPLLLPPLRQPL
jgi:gamma-tubulin complex component 2